MMLEPPFPIDVSHLRRVLTLADYNTRVVVLGVAALGVAAGGVGGLLLMRKRALLGDAISHAMLPGVAAAFLIFSALGAERSASGLLLGAALSGSIGVVCVLALTRLSRIREDAALGIVLSVFFGAGICLLSVVQSLRSGHAAGLNQYLYGKAAALLATDAVALGIAAGGVTAVLIALYRPWKLLCFDASYAAAQGWPVLLLDVLLMGLAIVVCVLGLGAVGLILVVALLVIPPAGARFWTDQLGVMLVISGVLGALSGYIGASLSAVAPRLPAGALIVLSAGLIFAISLLFGTRRGLLRRWLQHASLVRRERRQHLLRALYELSEASGQAGLTAAALAAHRGWPQAKAATALAEAQRAGLLRLRDDGRVELSEHGRSEARRVVRNHRLWELFLITHADIAPSHVDRDADEVEHVLDAAMVAELEALLVRDYPNLAAPASPHAVGAARGAS